MQIQKSTNDDNYWSRVTSHVTYLDGDQMSQSKLISALVTGCSRWPERSTNAPQRTKNWLNGALLQTESYSTSNCRWSKPYSICPNRFRILS